MDEHVHISVGYIPRSRIAGLYDMRVFSFMRCGLMLFENGFTNLQFHQQHMRIPIVLHSWQFWYCHSFIIVIATILMTLTTLMDV